MSGSGGGIWFTADLHFAHKLVSGIRGFETTDAHDAEICRVWRTQVKPEDTVWVLGDLVVAESKLPYALELLKGLPGTKHLVFGNHDAGHPMHRKAHTAQAQYFRAFASVQSAATVRIDRQQVLLSHFPYETDHTAEVRYLQWRLPNHDRWLLHGHTHSTVQRTSDQEIHVGWDAWKRLVGQGEIYDMIVEGFLW